MDEWNFGRYQCLVADVTVINKGWGKGKRRKSRGKRRYSQRATGSWVRPVILWLPLEVMKKDWLCRGLTSGAVIYFPGRTSFMQPDRMCQCLLQPGEFNLCAIQPLQTYPETGCLKEKSLGITKCFVIAFPCECRKLSHNRWWQRETSWLSLLPIISHVKTTSA